MVEATGDLIGDKIAKKITKISKNSQQNNLETVTNEHDKEVPKERCAYIFRRKTRNYWWAEIKIKLKFQIIYKKKIIQDSYKWKW